MKVACLVNNFQYGENRFEKMRQNYAYQDEQIDNNHHVVFLDVAEDDYKFLKDLLKSDLHNNVNKKSAFSEKGWIEMYKQRLHPKVNEDIEAEDDFDDTPIPDAAFDYISQATYRGEPFYIIWDARRLKGSLGIENADDNFAEEMYDLYFGEGHWGYEDYWYMCDYCGDAINSDCDEYQWLNSGCYCGECVKTEDDVTEEYLENCVEEDRADYLLDEDRLEELGWKKVCEEDWVNDSSSTYRKCELLSNLWGGNFLVSYRRFNNFEIWTDNNDVDPDNLWRDEEEDEE